MFRRRPKPDPEPVELDDVELVYEHPIVSPTWERWERWGVLKLLHATDDAVLWRQQINDPYEFPVTRHVVCQELLVVIEGAIKVLKYSEPDGSPDSAKVLVAGDVLKIRAGHWHQVIVTKPSILTVLWTPKGFEYRASPGDEEIWRPNRIVGRG